MSFSMPTTLPLTTEPSCRCPPSKDSSSILAKSSREGVWAVAVAVAMNSPVVRCAGGLDWRSKSAGRSFRKTLRRPPESRSAGANTVLLERWVSVRRPSAETPGGALSSNSEGRSAAPSARPGGLDDVDGGPDCAGYIHIGGVEQVRVRRLFQGRGGAAHVALVALDDVGQHRGLVDLPARRPGIPAPRRRARTCGAAVTKIFTSASGQMTVPMSRPSSTAPGGRAAKSRWKATSAARTSGMAETTEAASPTARALHGGLVEPGWIERARRGDRGGDVIERLAGIEQMLGHGAVDQAGVEMTQAVMGGKLLAERAFARGGGSVDGDDHLTPPGSFSLPSPGGGGSPAGAKRRQAGWGEL